MALVMGVAVSSIFPTPAARLEVDKLVGSMPDAHGQPVRASRVELGTLGGYMTFKYGAIFALGTALWSILALSVDARRRGPPREPRLRRGGAVRQAPHRAREAGGPPDDARPRDGHPRPRHHRQLSLFGDAALGDPIPPLSAFGFALWVGLHRAVLRWAGVRPGPLLGRAGAAGVAGLVMVVLWVANGLDTFGPIAPLSPFRWTADHVALVGRFDWAPLALVGICAAVFLAIGVELFATPRPGGHGRPVPPAACRGGRWASAGPIGRAFGDQLPRGARRGASASGSSGAMLASLVGSMASQLGEDANLMKTFATLFPSFDLTSAGGFLQLYVQMLYIAAGSRAPPSSPSGPPTRPRAASRRCSRRR